LDYGETLLGVIVETEAYLGVGIDRSAHMFSGKKCLCIWTLGQSTSTVFIELMVCMNISTLRLKPVQRWEGIENQLQFEKKNKKIG
jgi:3-methyladenine DNA glycosylase Mpg